MDRKTLFKFVKRIFESSSIGKAELTVKQLRTLLEEQGAPESDLQLLDKMLDSIPEMRGLSHDKSSLTEEDVATAHRRAKERKIREELARNRGRC